MSVPLDRDSHVGIVLANRLGLRVKKHEGHDLAGPCITCQSSDAFRMHRQTGVAYCYSCGGKWSPFQVAEAILGNRDAAKAVMVELGLFEPSPSTSNQAASKVLPDPIAVIAKAKGISPESLRVFGAKAITPYTVRLPAYGFASAYAGNRASANDVALEASLVARPLLALLEEQGDWVGTSSELLQALESRVSAQVKRQRIWPSNGRPMPGHLKRLAPNLRAAGWQVEFHRESSRRLWSIQRQAGFASADPFASPLRHGEIGADQCEPMPADASQQVHDASDANAGTSTLPSKRNGDGWEEGEL